MTDRATLLAQLKAHASWNEEEEGYRRQMVDFLATVDDCFERSHASRHFTASALVLDPSSGHVLLMHHRKLDRWLQPGGHADGECDLLAVAQKEVEEETGLVGLRVPSAAPFDLDIHLIPARKSDPDHYHYDVRFLFEGDRNSALVQNHESKGLQWVELEKAKELAGSESVSRMLVKAEAGWLPGKAPSL